MATGILYFKAECTDLKVCVRVFVFERQFDSAKSHSAPLGGLESVHEYMSGCEEWGYGTAV